MAKRTTDPNVCRVQEQLWLDDEIREAITAFHKSSGFDRTLHESIRELIWQGLSGDAKATAVRLAARRAYLDTKVLMLSRLGGTLKQLHLELNELIGITAAEANTNTALEEPKP